MVNGGIDKAKVRVARDALLKKGERITITSIREELGDTGSRTTILRHLQELDRQEILVNAPASQHEELQAEDDDMTERMTVLARNAVAIADEQHELVSQLKGFVNQHAGLLEFLTSLNQQLSDRTLDAENKYLEMRNEAEALQQWARDRDQQNTQLHSTLLEAKATLRQLQSELATLYRNGERATA
jgi:chromosome segregation ATPase